MAEPEPIRRPDEFEDAAHRESAPGQQSIGELVKELTSDVGDLIQAELRLAKREVMADAQTMARASAVLAIGGIIALLGLVYLLLAAVFALATTLAPWLAALIVGGIALVIGAVAVVIGLNNLRSVNPMPDQTMENVREDVTWLRNRMR